MKKIGEYSPRVGSELLTVLPGIPIGGYLPLWSGDDDVTYWRINEPSVVLESLARGILARSPIQNSKFREVVMLDSDNSTIVLMDLHSTDDGNISGLTTSLVAVEADEALEAETETSVLAAFRWVGHVFASAIARGEFVSVEPGGITNRVASR